MGDTNQSLYRGTQGSLLNPGATGDITEKDPYNIFGVLGRMGQQQFGDQPGNAQFGTGAEAAPGAGWTFGQFGTPTSRPPTSPEPEGRLWEIGTTNAPAEPATTGGPLGGPYLGRPRPPGGTGGPLGGPMPPRTGWSSGPTPGSPNFAMSTWNWDSGQFTRPGGVAGAWQPPQPNLAMPNEEDMFSQLGQFGTWINPDVLRINAPGGPTDFSRATIQAMMNQGQWAFGNVPGVLPDPGQWTGGGWTEVPPPGGITPPPIPPPSPDSTPESGVNNLPQRPSADWTPGQLPERPPSAWGHTPGPPPPEPPPPWPGPGPRPGPGPGRGPTRPPL